MLRVLATAAALAALARAESPVPQAAYPLTDGEWWLIVALYVAAATVAAAAWWVWRKKG